MRTIQFNPPRREAGFHAPGYWVWCPSVIKGDDSLYHLFCMRMPNTIPFHPGWATSSEIVHATSKTTEGQDGRYWMIAKDMSGVYCGEGYAPLIVSSADGIHWGMQEARKFFSRDITWSDGSAQTIGNLDRPALLIEDGKPTLACFAASKHHFGEDRPDHEIWILTVPIANEHFDRYPPQP
jgi:hypothetical protein